MNDEVHEGCVDLSTLYEQSSVTQSLMSTRCSYGLVFQEVHVPPLSAHSVSISCQVLHRNLERDTLSRMVLVADLLPDTEFNCKCSPEPICFTAEEVFAGSMSVLVQISSGSSKVGWVIVPVTQGTPERCRVRFRAMLADTSGELLDGLMRCTTLECPEINYWITMSLVSSNPTIRSKVAVGPASLTTQLPNCELFIDPIPMSPWTVAEFDRNGEFLFLGESSAVHLFSSASNWAQVRAVDIVCPVTRVEWSFDGCSLNIIAMDGTVFRWDCESPKAQPLYQQNEVGSIFFEYDDAHHIRIEGDVCKLVYTAGDEIVSVLEHRGIHATFKILRTLVNDLILLQRESYLLIRVQDSSLSLRAYNPFESRVIDANGSFVLLSSGAIIDPSHSTAVRVCKIPSTSEFRATALAVSPDKQIVAIGGSDGTVRYFSIPHSEAAKEFASQIGNAKTRLPIPVQSLHWSSRGSLVILGLPREDSTLPAIVLTIRANAGAEQMVAKRSSNDDQLNSWISGWIDDTPSATVAVVGKAQVKQLKRSIVRDVLATRSGLTGSTADAPSGYIVSIPE